MGIPIVDLRADGAGDRIAQACRDIGFFCIVGTGVREETVSAMRAAVARVFDVSEEEKHRQAVTRENYRGYIPLGFFTPNDGTGAADRYEGYKLHWEAPADDPVRRDCPLYGPNLWPDHAPETRDAVLAYWAALDVVAFRLLTELADGLELPAARLTAPFEKPLTNMTLLHYPPAAGEEAFGIHPHKDTTALTILAHDPVGGLEVRRRDGTWLAPDCPPDGFVVNIGDMLEIWSGGRYVSTPHRVTNRTGKQRYSFPYFMVPRHDVTVAPLVDPLPGFARTPIAAGPWSANIWRTNWPDQAVDETQRDWVLSEN